MTTKTISTYVTAGYSLAAKYSVLDITPTGEVGGYGVKLPGAATIDNAGLINAYTGGGSDGVTANAAATIINGSADDRNALIRGYSGVFAPNAAATVSNFGTIEGRGAFGDGVFLVSGGTVTNGAANDTSAVIQGIISGIAASVAAQVVNFGSIMGYSTAGVYLKAGGTVTNGSASDPRAHIQGPNGVQSAAGSLTVSNFRTIFGEGTLGDGIESLGGTTLTNGSASDGGAVVYGLATGLYAAGLGSVVNFGTIHGIAQNGVYLRDGGRVTNGSTSDGRATIKGATGGLDAPTGVSTVVNSGTIEATTSGDGVFIDAGHVTNGSTLAQGALIQGAAVGVAAVTASTTIANFGVIYGVGDGVSSGMGVSLKAGGRITNGAVNDTGALIEGEGFGVYSSGLVTIANFGTITAVNGLYLTGGATVTNGSAQDTTAAILASDAILIKGGVGHVTNFGTIIAYGDRDGVDLFTQGSLTNGSATDTAALIDAGRVGAQIDGMAGTVFNFGTIQADAADSFGVYLTGGSVTNGSATDKTATILARIGVQTGAGAAVTVTNYGTLQGFGGDALYFTTAGDTLNVEAGSAFVGAVNGYGGVLNLASGVGTISGLTSAGNVTVSGSMATTTFGAFDTLGIGVGARFIDAGVVSVLAGHTIMNAGTLTLGGTARGIVNAGLIETTGTLILAGAVNNGGTLYAAGGLITANGVVTGAGKVIIGAGTADFTSSLTGAVTFTAGSTGVLALAHSITYTATVTGLSITGANALDLGDISFTSGKTIASFAGNTTSGILTVTDGSHTAKIRLAGDYVGHSFVTRSDTHGGTIVVDPPGPAAFVSAMAGFGAGGGPVLALGRRWQDAPPMLALARHSVLA